MVEHLEHSSTAEDFGNPYLYRPHDTMRAAAEAVTETPSPYISSVERYFADIFHSKARNGNNSALFARQLASLDNMQSMIAGLQQHCPDSFLESFSGMTSDVPVGTQQQQQRGPFFPGMHQYPTPLSTIPPAHARHNSAPPHQQPLIPPGHTFSSNGAYDSTIGRSSNSFGPDPRDTTATGILANPENNNSFTWLSSESVDTYTTTNSSASTSQLNHYPHHFSHNRTASNCSLPSTATPDYLPSPPSHSNDKQLPPQLYIYDDHIPGSSSSGTFGLSPPAKQPKHSPPMTRQSSVSASSDFHLLGYGYTAQDQQAQPRFPNEGLADNNDFFPPLQMLHGQENNKKSNNNRRRRRQSSWQQERSNNSGSTKEQVLPVTSLDRADPNHDDSSTGAGSEQLPLPPQSSTNLLKQADERPHQCNHCKKGFNRQQDLKRHNKSVHEKQYVHDCFVCHRSFSRRDSLLRHQKKCRSDPSFSSSESSSDNSIISNNLRQLHPLYAHINHRLHPDQRRRGRLSTLLPLSTTTRQQPTL